MMLDSRMGIDHFEELCYFLDSLFLQKVHPFLVRAVRQLSVYIFQLRIVFLVAEEYQLSRLHNIVELEEEQFAKASEIAHSIYYQNASEVFFPVMLEQPVDRLQVKLNKIEWGVLPYPVTK